VSADRVRTGRVVVVGDLVTDVVVHASAPLEHGSDTPATIRVGGGGQAANTACWLAAAGRAVTLVARVGADAAGRERVGEVVAAGVDVAAAVDDGAPTGTVVVLVDRTGERSMLADRGAAARLAVADVLAALTPGGDAVRHLHVSGYALLGPGPGDAALRAIAAARAAGLSVSVDAASAAPLARDREGRLLAAARSADLLLANAAEARVLVSESSPGEAARALAGRVPAAVVKDGSHGAYWAAGDTLVHAAPAPPAGEVVDTTGAGDAFAAGLLHAWLAGSGPADALDAAAAHAALALGVLGGRPAS
jgi:ribokinase